MKTKNKLLTLLTLAAGAAAATAVINKCIKVSATSKNILAESKSLCYKWRFGNIHYTKTGSGKPILLVHDLTAFSSSYESVSYTHLDVYKRQVRNSLLSAQTFFTAFFFHFPLPF